MFKFLLNADDLTGTVIERRIDEVIGLGAKATQAYKMKKPSTAYA